MDNKSPRKRFSSPLRDNHLLNVEVNESGSTMTVSLQPDYSKDILAFVLSLSFSFPLFLAPKDLNDSSNYFVWGFIVLILLGLVARSAYNKRSVTCTINRNLGSVQYHRGGVLGTSLFEKNWHFSTSEIAGFEFREYIHRKWRRPQIIMLFQSGKRLDLLGDDLGHFECLNTVEAIRDFINPKLSIRFIDRWSGKPIEDLPANTSTKLITIFALIITMSGGLFILAVYYAQPNSFSTTEPSDSYERVEVWDIRGDDTAQFILLDTYPDEAVKRQKWISTPLMRSDTDIAKIMPLAGSLIDQRSSDYVYRGQNYRFHTYFIESSQPSFGYSITFKFIPHLHITGTTSRLLSIGVEPSEVPEIETKSVIAVVLPNGVNNINVTDMKPYKTLTSNNRIIYYYDVHPITSHQSIHIAYILTNIPTTNTDINNIINQK